jgi:hypothetical protein
MEKRLIGVAALWLTLALLSPASANSTSTITFDDVLQPGVNWGVVPNGYLGLDWQFIEVERLSNYQQTYNNYQLTFPSVPLAALNGGNTGGNELVSFSSAQPVLFEGAYFSTWAGSNTFSWFSSRELTVTGYLNGKEVGSTTFSLSPNFVWQEFNFGLVNQVSFRHGEPDDGHWWLMDNMQVSATPLPATLLLFVGGLIALGLFGKRRGPGKLS